MLRLTDGEEEEQGTASERATLTSDRDDGERSRAKPGEEWWNRQNRKRKGHRRAHAGDAIVDCTVILAATGTFCVALYLFIAFRRPIETAWDRQFGRQALAVAQEGCVKPQVALALAGDTWLGQTKAAGLMTGMLQVLARRNATGEAATVKELLQRFDAVSTSGSASLYFAELSYSPSFLQLQEAMGAEPHRAEELWQSRGIDRFVECASAYVDASFLETTYKAWSCGRNSSQETYAEAAADLLRALQTGGVNGSISTWEELTRVILYCAAGVSEDTRLGGPVNGFAHRKLWLIATSLPSPGGGPDSSQPVLVPALSASVEYRLGTEYEKAFPGYTPTKLALCLGLDGEKQRSFAAPLPFCGRRDCFQYHAEYTVYDGGLEYTGQSPPLWKVYYEELESAPGRVKLAAAVAASTACFGSAIFNSTQAAGFAQWVLLSSQAEAMAEKTPFKSQGTTFDEARASAPHAIIGGVFTDNTGILQAVASGAAEVAALVGAVPFATPVAYAGVSGFDSLLALFGFVSRHQMPFPATSSVNFQIFESANVRGMVETQFTSLSLDMAAIPSSRSALLSSIRFGTIEAKTVENEWAGIKGGKTIRLNLIVISSELNIESSRTSVHSLPQLLGEIVSVLTDANSTAQANQLLDTFFLGVAGASGEQIQM
mmetsp:Transcript_55118/g.131350  ORF Transcript_55118/g.131350 Transcript_55118/m.131350 type:complete len:659 (+) Transcript_55118:62-2038(+)